MIDYQTELAPGWQELVDETMQEHEAPQQFHVEITRDRDGDPRVEIRHIDCQHNYGYGSTAVEYPFPWFFSLRRGRRVARSMMRAHMKKHRVRNRDIEKYTVTFKP